MIHVASHLPGFALMRDLDQIPHGRGHISESHGTSPTVNKQLVATLQRRNREEFTALGRESAAVYQKVITSTCYRPLQFRASAEKVTSDVATPVRLAANSRISGTS